MDNKTQDKQAKTPAGGTAHGYIIYVKGHISPALLDWFADLRVEALENGRTRLWVTSTDQAFLYGVLLRLRDLGITLIAVESLNDC